MNKINKSVLLTSCREKSPWKYLETCVITNILIVGWIFPTPRKKVYYKVNYWSAVKCAVLEEDTNKLLVFGTNRPYSNLVMGG